VRPVARPHLEALRRELGQTVSLAQLDGADIEESEVGVAAVSVAVPRTMDARYLAVGVSVPSGRLNATRMEEWAPVIAEHAAGTAARLGV
jgi:DNA-binding IclR family transcriptional regulator